MPNATYIKLPYTTTQSLIKYGRLYPARLTNVAPSGYRIPSQTDVNTLKSYAISLSSTNLEANLLKHRRQINTPLGGIYNTTVHPRWNENATHYGTDVLNFGGLPTGLRSGSYANLGVVCYLWTTTESDTSQVYLGLLFNSGGLFNTSTALISGNQMAIRCMRDATTAEQLLSDGDFVETTTDYDGNVYDAVKIGTQVWLQQNLATTRDNNGNAITHFSYNDDINNVFFASSVESIWTLRVVNQAGWHPVKDSFIKVNGVWKSSTPHIKVPPITGKSLVKCGYGYNWYAVNDDRLFPIGYSLLDFAHYNAIKNYVANSTTDGMKIARMDGHPTPEYDTNVFPTWTYNATYIPTDVLKFSAIPCGYRTDRWNNHAPSYDRSSFGGKNKYNSIGNSSNISLFMHSNNGISTNSIDLTSDSIYNKNRMNTVRFFRQCLPFETTQPNGTIVDRVKDIDGNIYDMVKLGTLVVSRQNYACTKLNDGTPINVYTGNTAAPSTNTIKCSPVENYYNLGVSQAFFANEADSWWTEPTNINGWKSCSTLLSVGMEYQGGIIFYKDATRILIARQELLGVDGVKWGYDSAVLGCSDNMGQGYANTQLMIAANSPMGLLVDAINTAGSMGYSDWFIPSINEVIELSKTYPYYLKLLEYENSALAFNTTPEAISRLISSSENGTFYKYSTVTYNSPYYSILTISKVETIHNYDLIPLVRQILL